MPLLGPAQSSTIQDEAGLKPANGRQLSQVPIALSRPSSVLIKVTSARKAKTRNAMCRHDSLPVINPILDRCDGAWEGGGSGQVTVWPAKRLSIQDHASSSVWTWPESPESPFQLSSERYVSSFATPSSLKAASFLSLFSPRRHRVLPTATSTTRLNQRHRALRCPVIDARVRTRQV